MVYNKLKDLGHIVSVSYAMNDEQMIGEVEGFHPDMIICPFLKKFIPHSIYSKYPTFILHPGVVGDKGPYALDNAIREKKEEWGVVLLKANSEFDCGDIYASVEFKMRETYKASLYRNEVLTSTSIAIDKLFENLEQKDFTPLKQPSTPMHYMLAQNDRAIEWDRDTTKKILQKVYMSDSYPGVKDNILGVDVYLFGAWEEERLRGKPKEILAKRDGAICLGTVDGAIWITHLKEPYRFKLPATYVLKDRLKGVKEHRLPLVFDESYKTFYEISCDIKDDVGYLYFNFHNGAFSANQCIKLKYAFEYIKSQVKIVVLMGGTDFFSNGIHLNILEDSKKNGEDGWSNINAMNDLVKSIIFADDVVTVASLEKNSGAGGVFLALACDYVVACENAVLNPHYKTIGLSGSEYHTYTFPRRVGEQKAQKLLDDCLPISAKYAKDIGMIDELYEINDYQKSLESFCQNLLGDEDDYENFLWDKEEFLEQNVELIEKHREDEIKTMYPEFWHVESEFHKLRYEFVYKICPTKTPKRLIYKG
jgi:putative two-component system hydrogenase maturation factor HypX/HoxX